MRVLAALFFSTSAFGFPSHQHHLDLDLTGREYRELLKKAPNFKSLTSEDQEIEKYLAIGKRNLQWVDFVNASRSPERKLSLSSPATQNGNGPEAPRFYNFKMIKAKWNVVQNLIPKALKKVVFEGGEFTTDLGVTDREFMEWLFQVDSAYQISARYKLMLPYLEDMKKQAAYDVRGYLQLRDEEDLENKLENFEYQSDLKQSRLTKSLTMICMNSEKNRLECKQELALALRN